MKYIEQDTRQYIRKSHRLSYNFVIESQNEKKRSLFEGTISRISSKEE